MNKIVPDSIVDAITKECYVLKDRIKELEARLTEAEGFRASHETCCLEPVYRQERDQARRDLDRKDHECASLKASIRELETRLEAVKALHAPYGIYDECPHTHTSEDEPGVIDVESVGLTCEEGRLYTVCRVCHCDENGDMREDLDEAGYPCPTRRAAEGKP